MLIKGGDIAKSGNEDSFRKLVDKTVKLQYRSLTPAEFEQLSEGRVLLIDDFQDGPTDPKARRRLLDYIAVRFHKIVLVASDDFYLELLDRRGEAVSGLLLYQRYELGDFGRQRLEDLAMRWTALGSHGADPSELKSTALDLCEKVESILAVAGLPHTPWLLVVMLEHEGSPDTTIAAKNGDYGHLYQAVITVQLSRSRFKNFTLNGKFSYLAELAYHLHRTNRPTLKEQDAREFHASYSDRYDMTFDYERVRDDLIDVRMLRLDGDELAFRHKYVYAFFVAYSLSRNIHKHEVHAVINELCGRLHHDISANILVFLAHLTDNPIVLEQMQSAAASLFRDALPAKMEDDVRQLDELPEISGSFQLPSTAPDVNRKLLQDVDDEQLAKRTRASQDGRTIRAIPEEAGAELDGMHRRLREIRATIRTIRILGQILRNKAQSAESQDKVALMEQIVALGRRLLGHIYGYLRLFDATIRDLRRRLMRVLVEQKRRERVKSAEARTSAATNSQAGLPKLTRAELRELWSEATSLARRFWFDLYWFVSFTTIKRLAAAVGSKDLDATFAKVLAKDPGVPNQLLELAIRLSRRGRSIPADDLVRLHKSFVIEKKKVARVVLEAISWERLLLFDTDVSQKQQICKEMGIKVPISSLDPATKKFKSS